MCHLCYVSLENGKPCTVSQTTRNVVGCGCNVAQMPISYHVTYGRDFLVISYRHMSFGVLWKWHQYSLYSHLKWHLWGYLRILRFSQLIRNTHGNISVIVTVWKITVMTVKSFLFCYNAELEDSNHAKVFLLIVFL